MLTVLHKIENHITPSGISRVQWLCKCDCGNLKKCFTYPLTSGITKDCGCQKGKYISDSLSRNLIGRRYGKLVVVGEAGYKENGTKKQKLWLCKCDCGNEIVATTVALNGGHKRSCGCLRRSDIIGKKFGMLTVLEYCGRDKNHESLWRCRCDCGNERICQLQYLKKSKMPTCGCINPLEKHGKSHSRIYFLWKGMKARCYNKNEKAYKHYGGRGIKVCDEWLDKESGFENFQKWIYSVGYDDSKLGREQSVDRIDVNGNYEPSNCRLATQKEQLNNQRRNINIEYMGKVMTAKQWSEELGIDYKTIKNRIKRGLPAERILSKEMQR